MEKTAPIKKILVVVLDNLGDTIMATSVLKPLKRLYPHAQIGFWTKNYAADLLHDQSLIDTLHASDPFWDVSPGHAKGSRRAFFKTVWAIRRAKYDLAVVLNAEWRRAGFVRLAGIPIRLGLDRRKSQFFLTKAFPVPPAPSHFVDDHLSILKNWSGQTMDSEECWPRLELNLQEKKDWTFWSEKTGWASKSFLAVHPFAGDILKTWPLSRWTELLQNLFSKNKNTRALILCGPGEEGKLYQLMGHLPPGRLQALTGVPLSTIKAILAHAQLLVGGDSGPGHIAAAIGVPVLSLFSMTDPKRSRPMGHVPLQIIQRDPISSIEVAEVEQALDQMLGATV